LHEIGTVSIANPRDPRDTFLVITLRLELEEGEALQKAQCFAGNTGYARKGILMRRDDLQLNYSISKGTG
jgi:hypothetical protein